MRSTGQMGVTGMLGALRIAGVVVSRARVRLVMRALYPDAIGYSLGPSYQT